MNPQAFAIPVFIFFLALEFLIARYQQKRFFKFQDTVSNLSIGIAERLLDVFITSSSFFLYFWLYHKFAIFEIDFSIITMILLLLFADFVWYWYHRLGHNINLFWGAHIVHHQSEEFNFSVAARITVFQSFIRVLFWSVLPIIGFKPEMITLILLIHGSYSFFTHTNVVGKLGFLEYIFVTPSHHRVHHACNPQYIDKNFGDIFIIWDKLFGTFEVENETPVFGLTKQNKSKNFLWQHFHFFFELFYEVKQTPSIKNKLALILGKPEKVNPINRTLLENKLKIRSLTNEAIPRKIKVIITIQMFISGIFLFLYLLFKNEFNTFSTVLLVVIIICSMIHVGGMLSNENYIFETEIIRVSLLLSIFVSFFTPGFLIILTLIPAILLMLKFEKIKDWYLRFFLPAHDF